MSHPKNMKLRPSPADWETYILSSAKDRLEYSVYKPEPKSSFGPVQKFLKKTFGIRKKSRVNIPPQPQPQPTFNISPNPNNDETTSVLPPEIWTEIFYQVCDEAIDELISLPVVNREQRRQAGPYGYHWPAPKLDLMPVTISHVCRYWNQLITTNPKFWNRIFMYMHPKTFAPVYHLDLWMERSAPLPVSLYFDAISYYNPTRLFYPELHEPLQIGISAIHHYARRFEHLSLKLCSDGLQIWDNMIERGHTLNGPLCLDFALLESVDITSEPGRLYGDDRMRVHHSVAGAICANREKVSRLRSGSHVYVKNIEYSPLDELHIPVYTYMTALTSLELTYIRIDIPVSAFVSHISLIQKLTELWLVGTTFHDIMDSEFRRLARPDCFGFIRQKPRTRVVLPSIEKLHLLVSTQPDSSRCQYVSDCVAFLAGVSLPNLTALDMDEHSIASFLNGKGPTRWTYLYNMLSDSGCILRSLKLILKDSLRPEHHCQHWEFFQSVTCSSLQELTIQPRIWNTQDVLYLLDGLHRSYRYRNNNKDPTTSVARLDTPVIYLASWDTPPPTLYATPLATPMLHTTPLVTPTLKRLTILGCITEDEPLVRLATSRMVGENSCLEYLYIEVDELHPDKHPKAIQLFDDLYKQGKKAYLRKPPALTALQYSDSEVTPKPELVPVEIM